jgi:DNA-binding MurR/RpiR family transcriptional regulator
MNMDDLSGTDLELMIAQTERALRELADEAERDGVNEYLSKLFQEQQRRLREYFNQFDQDLSQLGNPLKPST